MFIHAYPLPSEGRPTTNTNEREKEGMLYAGRLIPPFSQNSECGRIYVLLYDGGESKLNTFHIASTE